MSKLKMSMNSGENLSNLKTEILPHQDELQQLGELAGIHMDTKVFRIIVGLLNLGADSDAIFAVLKTIKRSVAKHDINRTF